MAQTLDPDTEARFTALGRRLGWQGPEACQKALTAALEMLESHYPPRPKMTPEEIGRDLESFREAGRKWREEHPDEYDENNPPSKAWQEELYDENGLPR